MGGLFVDIFVVYLVRILYRAWRKRGTSTWDVREAKVESISRAPTGYGCPVVNLVYSYAAGDGNGWGSTDIPFVWLSSADDYVQRHPVGSSLAARVKPGDPEISILHTGVSP